MADRTLCLLVRGDGHKREILLGMKKRGFGQGKWNGFGGKVQDGEGIIDAAKREVLEEAGVRVDGLEKMAIIDFSFPYKPEWDNRVHVFLTKVFEGEPVESEEMKPQWFSVTKIPYDRMWTPDTHWIPRVLGGEKIHASFTFKEGEQVDRYNIQSVSRLA
ncbi:MAG: 8-oxo-dGTP diphosphatase [Candidatus Aenigmarchaeota archaeon]|nr:8-oxo-dGTP diphosphatase [Candidatus Aenigmarchaeota archaeon]